MVIPAIVVVPLFQRKREVMEIKIRYVPLDDSAFEPGLLGPSSEVASHRETLVKDDLVKNNRRACRQGAS